MAANRKYAEGHRALPLTPTSGGVAAGDPCVAGQIPGVSLNGGGAVVQSVAVGGVYTLTVNGVDGSGNSAVAQGDILYYVAGDTIKISKKATGVRFGYAMGTLASGASGKIDVILGY